MKKTCLIHQQQGIGDLIFIQKIIAKYVEDGFDVVCPIKIEHKVIRDHFSSDRVRYPLISEQDRLLEDFEFMHDHVRLVSECESQFGDLAFAKPFEGDGFVFLALGPAYKRLPAEGLMLSKYRLAGIDYAGWQDHVPANRNYDGEIALWEYLGLKRNMQYTLVNEFSSNGRLEIPVPGDAIYMRKTGTFTLFDWITVLERCSRLITVDTALVWLAEVFLKRRVPLSIVSKWSTGQPSFEDFRPALRLPWTFVPRVSELKLGE